MKNNISKWFENIVDIVFSELFQAKCFIVTFSVIGVASLICSFWNVWQLAITVMCVFMVLCGIIEYKKAKKQ